jgi:hypothetical protein
MKSMMSLNIRLMRSQPLSVDSIHRNKTQQRFRQQSKSVVT